MKKTIIIILALLCVFSLTSCVEIKDESETKKIGTVTTKEKEQTKDTTPQETAPAATVGEYVQGEKWKISLLSAKIYDQIGDGLLIDKPAEGKKFLILFFEVQNISNEDDYFNRLYVESYVNGCNQREKLLFNDVDGYGALTGDVAAGKKLKGFLAWEIGSDFEELELSYNDGIIIKDKYKFLVKPENISNYNG